MRTSWSAPTRWEGVPTSWSAPTRWEGVPTSREASQDLPIILAGNSHQALEPSANCSDTAGRESTPPNQTSTATRQSSRIRTPLKRPGFVQTHKDSRQALSLLVPPSPSINQTSQSNDCPPAPAEDVQRKKTNSSLTSTQSKSVTGASKRQVNNDVVDVDLDQDSDAENSKATNDTKKEKDGCDAPKLHYDKPFKAVDQTEEGAFTYKCNWCPKSVRVNKSTDSNLKTHRDGSLHGNRLHKACVGRAKAITQGANLPESAEQKNAAKVKKAGPSGTLTNYVQKGRFDVKNSESKISLVANVWMTKGNHHAFIGISVCYINKKWEYVSQHWALKFVSWHHNGKYLAAPFANVLIKHQLNNQITLTTDSGSNNFPMAREMSTLIGKGNGDFEHYIDHHPRCFCHVLALILGAGLKNLRLSCAIKLPTNKPAYFPTLTTVEEVKDEDEQKDSGDSNIQEINDDADDKIAEIDPDDASEAEECPLEAELPTLPSAEGGIGHTLMKIDYICRRISSSAAQRSEFKLIAKSQRYTGPGLIAGYGIRWNIAYDSWQRAYKAKKVINQLLDNETDWLSGKSAAAHFFKGYEISKKEWENINSLTIVLEEFLALTLRLEDNGPNSSMILYEYYRLIENLEKRKNTPEFAVLKAMFKPMIKIAKKYQTLALQCSPILLATVLHPAWRLGFIQDKFSEYSDVAKDLLQSAFKAKSEAHKKMVPQATDLESAGESDGDKFNYYPEKSGASQEDTELKKYIDGQWPLSKKGDALQWWKLHTAEFPRLALVARDALACAGTSATVERTFSAAADVCEPGRSLAAPTIERCVSSHMWLQKGIKVAGEFTEAQSVVDTAAGNDKFKTYIANKNKKYKAKKIKHVAAEAANHSLLVAVTH
ncbi:hypothetical protein MJO28_002637 [Puccinia striiformis f. sp. tritici]|uniref:Uncharacterized protein n=1 Tax=Puccinia striiformis f. sp. tritici TaxID=168172 RepID=A0ACC0ESI7_9BASI|nr:hypothetical protein MJO28_002637 [Puccinia striiformis f. sp. tritici]